MTRQDCGVHANFYTFSSECRIDIIITITTTSCSNSNSNNKNNNNGNGNCSNCLSALYLSILQLTLLALHTFKALWQFFLSAPGRRRRRRRRRGRGRVGGQTWLRRRTSLVCLSFTPHSTAVFGGPLWGQVESPQFNSQWRSSFLSF